MDQLTQKYLDYLLESLDHIDVTGFELLEFLDVRSRLADREPLLSDQEKVQLENLDRRFLSMSDFIKSRILEVADLAEMRKRSHVLPSHWWWYLDEISQVKQKIAV
ncbi:MAG: hypothetical protein HY879_14900 [Deltaproteobacteria bacterium]|nr:hypothetical protein [Deltaproteobacteria bacterium]